MSKYGSGLTSGQIANMEKDEIKQALRGYLVTGECEEGFIYDKGDKADCDKVIIAAYDSLYFQLEQALSSARALAKIARDHGYEMNLEEYGKALEATKMESDYKYEVDEE